MIEHLAPITALRHLFAGFVFMSQSKLVFGCPYCDSPTGRKVRAAIFNDDFLANAILILLPFLVLGAVAAAVYCEWPWDFAGRIKKAITAVARPNVFKRQYDAKHIQ